MQQQSSTNEAALHAVDYWQVIKNRYGVILVTLLLVFMTAAVITYVMPKKYESRAVIQVKLSELPIQMFQGSGKPVGADTYSPTFFATEFQIIKSQKTLKQVSQSLGLANKWAMNEDDSLDLLRSIIRADNERGTDLLNITVRHPNNIDARDIAKAVYETYKSRREQKEKEIATDALKGLAEAVQQQNDRVEEKQKARNALLKKTGMLNYMDPTLGAGPMRLNEEASRSIAQTVQVAKEKLQKLEIQIAEVSKMDQEALLRYAGASEFSTSEIKTLYPQYQTAERELSAMRANGYGPRHPKIISVETILAALKSDLTKAVVAFKDSLNITRSTAAEDLASLEKMFNQKNGEAIVDRVEAARLQGLTDEYKRELSILENMQAKYSIESINVKQPREFIELHEEPVIGSYPVSPNVTLNLILGAVVGLIFGIGTAFFLEYLDTSVKSLEDVERYLQVPVLAVIPKDVGILHKQSGMSPDAEAYRILRTNIEFNRKNPEDNALTVVSGGAGEGKSTTLVNLAYICAQGGYTTLMIDADLRRPRLHTFFDINNSVGLTNYLTTELMLEDVILQTPVENLFFMPSGILPADAAGILNSRRMSELIQDVKQRFDLVLIDSPPILGVSDASVLASEVDLTMIVVQHRKLPRNMLLRVKQSVENVGGHVIGVVLNNVDVRSDSQYQYYTSYYTYYAPAESQIGPAVNPQTGRTTTPISSPTANTAASNNNDQLY